MSPPFMTDFEVLERSKGVFNWAVGIVKSPYGNKWFGGLLLLDIDDDTADAEVRGVKDHAEGNDEHGLWYTSKRKALAKAKEVLAHLNKDGKQDG